MSKAKKEEKSPLRSQLELIRALRDDRQQQLFADQTRQDEMERQLITKVWEGLLEVGDEIVIRQLTTCTLLDNCTAVIKDRNGGRSFEFHGPNWCLSVRVVADGKEHSYMTGAEFNDNYAEDKKRNDERRRMRVEYEENLKKQPSDRWPIVSPLGFWNAIDPDPSKLFKVLPEADLGRPSNNLERSGTGPHFVITFVTNEPRDGCRNNTWRYLQTTVDGALHAIVELAATHEFGPEARNVLLASRNAAFKGKPVKRQLQFQK